MYKLALFALAVVSGSSTSFAAASCGRWISQNNGMEWRMCVDDQNRQYCEMRKGRTIKPMRCP